MEYGKAFTFVNEDEKWVSKLLIGAVMAFLGFVIIPVFISLGYSVEILENVANGSVRPLPEWDDFFGSKLRKGLNIFVIRFVYALPLIVFACCYVLVQIALTSSLGGTSQGNATANPNGSLGAIASIIALCFICFAVIYGILMTLAVDAATIIYVSTGQLNSAFKFREVIAFTQKYVSELFLTALMLALANLFLGGLVSLITCGIGYPVVSAWVEYARGHLLGQIYRRAGLPPPPVIPSPMGAPAAMPPMQPT